jgi:hypothetical protein
MRSGCSARSRTGVLGDFESVTVGVDPLEPDVRAKRLDDAELQGTLDAILAAGWCRWTSVASRSSTTAPANSDETFSGRSAQGEQRECGDRGELDGCGDVSTSLGGSGRATHPSG